MQVMLSVNINLVQYNYLYANYLITNRYIVNKKYLLGTALTALLCGCSVVKLNFYFHLTASWLWLVWTNSPVFTPTRV